MKAILRILAGISGMAVVSSHGALIAFWDFNDEFDETDKIPQIVHSAAVNSGIIYQQQADTDGNGKGGIAFVDPANGINVTAGKTMAWDDVSKTGENDAEFFITLSTAGYEGIVISMDVKGNVPPDAGIVSYDLKYSLSVLVDVTNPGAVVGTIKDFESGVSTSVLNNESITTDDTFTRIVVDLSGVTAIDDQGTVALRFDDWRDNDSLSIDNLMVTGTVVPEPSVSLAMLIGLTGMSLLRRR